MLSLLFILAILITLVVIFLVAHSQAPVRLKVFMSTFGVDILWSTLIINLIGEDHIINVFLLFSLFTGLLMRNLSAWNNSRYLLGFSIDKGQLHLTYLTPYLMRRDCQFPVSSLKAESMNKNRPIGSLISLKLISDGQPTEFQVINNNVVNSLTAKLAEAGITLTISNYKSRYDTFWQRCGANIIDSLIFLPLAIIGWFIINSNNHYFMELRAFFALIITLYNVYFHGRFGQTLGKKYVGVKVYALDEIHPIGFKKAFYREIIPLIMVSFGILYAMLQTRIEADVAHNYGRPFSAYHHIYSNYNDAFSMANIWILLEVITMFLNEKRRALHDYLAGSVVVNLDEQIKEAPEPTEANNSQPAGIDAKMSI